MCSTLTSDSGSLFGGDVAASFAPVSPGQGASWAATPFLSPYEWQLHSFEQDNVNLRFQQEEQKVRHEQEVINLAWQKQERDVHHKQEVVNLEWKNHEQRVYHEQEVGNLERQKQQALALLKEQAETLTTAVEQSRDVTNIVEQKNLEIAILTRMLVNHLSPQQQPSSQAAAASYSPQSFFPQLCPSQAATPVVSLRSASPHLPQFTTQPPQAQQASSYNCSQQTVQLQPHNYGLSISPHQHSSLPFVRPHSQPEIGVRNFGQLRPSVQQQNIEQQAQQTEQALVLAQINHRRIELQQLIFQAQLEESQESRTISASVPPPQR